MKRGLLFFFSSVLVCLNLLGSVVQARSIEEQLAESFNKLMSKADSGYVYNIEKRCENKLLEHQIHFFDDESADYYTVPIFLPSDFQETDETCGKINSLAKYARKIEKTAKDELKIIARQGGCFRQANFKLKFHANDSGIVYKQFNKEDPVIVGSFTINPL